ncbi:MAG: UDP-N-acetylglucosamine--N-acetylmuramyl-(pentapeptide) pyrophosphoryl-undecaprenol N-acetylglucosamine transferase [Candidatus Moranbacteria bacterium]|jgi:UDP-N-acetylglucosamine--N-acetylmuramyl-(pentapeptide) pyrophosphoryl-undecaprenol N-acetylglucosamine transferase|nr:UDP-N-acetylglucosamine--N-acetylmuramyl-(pentapeptide) pyrophosphoryl-undecaprenol N-acetylglucosamine transferase [Candidatus Moranbacteria bacterium]MBP9801463.1 UDP-N-acetylglucosamine--N-acetylmuramyl-(pentapeptide) pyrophosphoryl-undecaprenol N-acetylglucosamine transferase [Candidatus Moranbacteria bacterium]
MANQIPRVVLSGGISGGHTYPLVAVARVLRKRYPQGIELLFLGGGGVFEETAMKAENIPMKSILYGKMRRYFSLLNYLDFFKLPLGVVQALWHLLFFMPDVIFSKGGAASVPVVLAARFYRIPVLIHDSDSVAGRANVLLGKWVQKIAIAYPSAAQYFPVGKTALTGNPVREEILAGSKERAKESFHLDLQKKTVVLFGGSQGAHGLNNAFLQILPALLMKGVQVIHQTGRSHFEGVLSIATELGIPTENGSYHPVAFLSAEEMGDALAAADIVISRAGAGSIAEVAAHRKALILVPLSTAANNEQRKNAYDIAEIGGALVLEEANLGEHLFLENLENVMNNDGLRAEMGEKLHVFYHADAAERITDGLIDLMV